MPTLSHLPTALTALLLLCAHTLTAGPRTAACEEDTPIDDGAPYSVTLSFWKSSEVSDTSVPDPEVQAPELSLEMTWTDPTECFVWVRTVLGSDELRANVGSDFELVHDAESGLTTLTYTQNASRCCAEFATTGTVKVFDSETLVEDESTAQLGDPLMVAVTDYRMPEEGEAAQPTVSVSDAEIAQGSQVTVDIALAAGADAGANADWWVLAQIPGGDWYHYDVGSDGWKSGLTVTHQGGLFELGAYEVLRYSGLPRGTTTFYFGVDFTRDGAVSFGSLIYDEASVLVE
jgi:hypothetical protein